MWRRPAPSRAVYEARSEAGITSRKRQLSCVLATIFAALLVATPGVSSPRTASKQAEAQRVLGEIQQIDAGLEKIVEEYDAAQSKLDQIKANQRENERNLALARANYKRAQAVLARRLVTIYTSQDQSAIEVLLGATSLTELVDRLDTVTRVSDQDKRIVREVVAFREQIKKREVALANARDAQEKLVAEKAAKRQQIEGQLAQRRQLLASIKSQIAQIQAAEAKRQQRLASQAQQRISSTPTASSSNGGGGGGGGGGGAATADGAAGSPPPSSHGGVVGVAMRYLGVPYVWGGASPSGFDCSGFTMYVYAQVGVSLPHNAAAQYSMGTPVSRASLQPGDLVFFNGLGHVGLYIGGGQFVHAPHTGSYVKIDSLSGWYASTYVGARRY